MRCFYHPEVESVGICQECGKSACKQCIEDYHGAMCCKDCMARHQTETQMRVKEKEERRLAELAFARQQARKRIRWSYVWALFGLGVFGFLTISAFATNEPVATQWLFMTPLSGYVCWSIYWGFVWIWPKWRGWVRRFRAGLSGWILFARLFTWLIILFFYVYCYFTIPFVIAIYYGVFGGGIYQFCKHRELAAA